MEPPICKVTNNHSYREQVQYNTCLQNVLEWNYDVACVIQQRVITTL